jgi:aspartate carbamoyltransferase catalytic subunit
MPGRSTSILDLRSLSSDQIRALLRLTAEFDPICDVPSTNTGHLAGRTVALLFMEDSTRTRLSFMLACRRLGGEAIDLPVRVSSTNKGETDTDTARTIEAMGVDAIVVRSPHVGTPHRIARSVRCPVVNAGDGTHEHPTQGLLDAYTIAKATGRDTDFTLSGVRVAIVGDIAHSRVARSAIAALTKLGAEVVCVGPPGLAPGSLVCLGCTIARDFDDELPRADVVIMLRVQFERHAGASEAAKVAWVRDFRAACALTVSRAERLKEGAYVMHPGPLNRGIEIDPAIADGPRSLVLHQVRHGVAVRMAVLAHVLAAGVQ